MSSALFGSSQSSKSKNLVEFKAGKMSMVNKTVHPDKRKGLVYVYQSDDALMHFCWKDRTSGIVEDDLMIFPDDVEIKKVSQCTTGRVYLLRFKSSNKKLFFWMQETESDKDEKLWKKVNDSLNNPPAPGSSSSSTSAGERATTSGNLANVLNQELSGMEGSELHNLIGSMSEQQLQMFLGGFMPVNSPSSNRTSTAPSSQPSRAQSTVSATRAEQTAASSSEKKPSQVESGEGKKESGQKMQFSDFQNILGNLAQELPGRQEVDLSELVPLDLMAPILANNEIQQRLMQHLPDSEILPKTEEEVRTTLTTPQFKKAMSSFGHALQSGQLGPLLQQFNLPDEVTSAAAQGNLEAFAKAMETYAQQKKEKKTDDDQMDTK
ncbi:proteasomal ubiquitin receptor ADRM1 isoform X1 [Brachionus plicatilis]|uniref:Proteasomal ubiquitin receptor ADRM1 isoform X1 n=1 Tax=Brachionus plicatilis TaxID=10195 RepID=A0A3M7T5N3_BRAPC|nr:proteasomal ubiquitin receptor ADRM1 isoform X1 [Brachionus plicatilis]